MATDDIIVVDGKQIHYANNNFPARTKLRINRPKTGVGAWLVDHRKEPCRFKTILPRKSGTSEEIRELSQKNNNCCTQKVAAAALTTDIHHNEDIMLDGFFLLQCSAAQDPNDLIISNVSGQGLSEAKPDDFVFFENVISINASENLLTLEPFSQFPELHKLEIAVNGIRGITLSANQFPYLQELDISYNNLSAMDILMLGLLSNLRILNISGNNLRTFCEDMSCPSSLFDEEMQTEKYIERFSSLEKLIADDNRLSDAYVFSAVAGLRRLQYLSLAKNSITTVPHLFLVEAKYIAVEDPIKQTIKKTQHKLKRHLQDQVIDGKENSSGSEFIAKQLTVQDASLSTKTWDRFDFSLETEEFQLSGTLRELSDLSKNLAGVSSRSFESACEPIEDKEFNATRPPPFCNLICLNLAYNQISHEKALLSVASWPKFKELIIHDNPLTTENSGELHILKELLNGHFGIHIQRKKAAEAVKPHIIISNASRKIKTKIPLIPRCKIEDLLSAINDQTHSILEDAVNELPVIGGISASATKLLPPIQQLKRSNNQATDKIASGIKQNTSETNTEQENQTTGDVWSEGIASNPIFMTEMINDVHTQKEEGVDVEKTHDVEKLTSSGECLSEDEDNGYNEDGDRRGIKIKKAEKFYDDAENLEIQEKYKGYEELLALDECSIDSFLPATYDVSGNVRALRHTLSIPLIFKDNSIRLEKTPKRFQSLTKKAEITYKPNKTRSENTLETVENLKIRSAFTEDPLTIVLSQKSQHKEFQEARKLLKEVQQLYSGVRVFSGKLTTDAEERNIKPLFEQKDKTCVN